MNALRQTYSTQSEFVIKYPAAGSPCVIPPARSPSAISPAAPVVRLDDPFERTKARFRKLRSLTSNHDGEGASAANRQSVDRAIAFLETMWCSHRFSATLNDQGLAVLEFDDPKTGFFADITFDQNGNVECYRRGHDTPSKLISGPLSSPTIVDFLTTEIGLVL